MRIICFGDSNTYGYDPRGWGGRYGAGERWVDSLAALCGHEVVNAGANGREVPRHPASRQAAEKYGHADVFLVMLGTNDLLEGASASETAARMGDFLHRLSPRQILLVAPPPMVRGAWVPTDGLVRESVQLAEEYRRLGVPFVDTRSWNIPMAFDGVHFTEEGHRIFASRLAPYLPR